MMKIQMIFTELITINIMSFVNSYKKYYKIT